MELCYRTVLRWSRSQRYYRNVWFAYWRVLCGCGEASAGVDATVNRRIYRHSDKRWSYRASFLISAFIATAMGTSMVPSLRLSLMLGIADSAGMSIPLTAGVVLLGMLGDNLLSFLILHDCRDTRSQGCEMRHGAEENIRIALPAARTRSLSLLSTARQLRFLKPGPIEWLKVLPYITILILAVSGMNVFVVLNDWYLGWVGMSLGSVENYGMTDYAQDIYAGFGNMQEIFLLSMLIGGRGANASSRWLAFLTSTLVSVRLCFGSHLAADRSCEWAVAAGLVSMVNLCTAKQHRSDGCIGRVLRQLGRRNNVFSTSLSKFSWISSVWFKVCCLYGAQVLLLGSRIQPIAARDYS